MKRLILFALLFAALATVGASNSYAQQGVVSIGQVQGLISGDTVAAGAPVRFLIHFQNNTTRRCDVSNGFRLYSPDGATWDSTTMDSIGPIDDGGTPEDSTDDVNIYFQKWFGVVNALLEFGWLGGGQKDDY